MHTLYTLPDLMVLSTKISNGIYTYSLLVRILLIGSQTKTIHKKNSHRQFMIF
jgi:hypothetical protein